MEQKDFDTFRDALAVLEEAQQKYGIGCDVTPWSCKVVATWDDMANFNQSAPDAYADKVVSARDAVRYLLRDYSGHIVVNQFGAEYTRAVVGVEKILSILATARKVDAETPEIPPNPLEDCNGDCGAGGCPRIVSGATSCDGCERLDVCAIGWSFDARKQRKEKNATTAPSFYCNANEIGADACAGCDLRRDCQDIHAVEWRDMEREREDVDNARDADPRECDADNIGFIACGKCDRVMTCGKIQCEIFHDVQNGKLFDGGKIHTDPAPCLADKKGADGFMLCDGCAKFVQCDKPNAQKWRAHVKDKMRARLKEMEERRRKATEVWTGACPNYGDPCGGCSWTGECSQISDKGDPTDQKRDD